MRARIEKFDHAAMLAVSRRRHPLLTGFLQVITVTGQGWCWGLLVIILWAGIQFDFLRFPNREFTLFATLSPGIAWIVVKALKVAWRRRRPFQILKEYTPLTTSPLDDSFPSGHTASVFAFLFAMSPLGPMVTVPLAAWAGLVAFSRYYLGVHFPSDIFVGAVIGIASGSVTLGIHSAYGADHYPSFTQLAKNEKIGESYLVEKRDLKAKVLVLAIHGGTIEPGTAEIAAKVAGSDLNLYIFKGLKPDAFENLHVTSSHFDDPSVLTLAHQSRHCVSIHGYKDASVENVCLGGGNRNLRGRVETALKKEFPDLSIRIECKTIAGVDPKNIVNRCREKGVQIELSMKLRDRLRADPNALNKFSETVRSALKDAP